jgi:hypothetical protein
LDVGSSIISRIGQDVVQDANSGVLQAAIRKLIVSCALRNSFQKPSNLGSIFQAFCVAGKLDPTEHQLGAAER